MYFGPIQFNQIDLIGNMCSAGLEPNWNSAQHGPEIKNGPLGGDVVKSTWYSFSYASIKISEIVDFYANSFFYR